MFLSNGKVFDFGDTHSIVNQYLTPETSILKNKELMKDHSIRRGGGEARFDSIIINNNAEKIEQHHAHKLRSWARECPDDVRDLLDKEMPEWRLPSSKVTNAIIPITVPIVPAEPTPPPKKRKIK